MAFSEYDRLIQYVARHPLQEQVVDTFVPNDARVAGGFSGLGDSDDVETLNSVVLCTGANACGKVRHSIVMRASSMH